MSDHWLVLFEHNLVVVLINVAVCMTLLYSLVMLRRTSERFGNLHTLEHIEEQLDEISKQNARLQREIHTDGLTRIGNRAQFDVSYRMEWDRAQREHCSLALLLVDIDLFKKINDEHGHLVGDECLVAVALAVRGSLLRASDRVMRYGGEEFVVLLGSSDDDGIQLVCQRILESVKRLEFDQGIQLSVSIGASSVVPAAHQSSQEFLNFVDQALYEAKSNGRDTYVIKHPSQKDFARSGTRNVTPIRS